jgi:hypothetical protein
MLFKSLLILSQVPKKTESVGKFYASMPIGHFLRLLSNYGVFSNYPGILRG